METKRISRPQAIERIREMLTSLTNESECACATTARFGVFCEGQKKMTDREFRSRYFWIARVRPKASREELEQLVCAYHAGRQLATGAALCCDLETREHCGCNGWNDFDNRALEKVYAQMVGEPIEIV